MLFAVAVMGIAAGSAWAQASGQIAGTVRDAAGGVQPGVTVTVSGPALQGSLTQLTSERGTYHFPVVPVGSYAVTFVIEGFRQVSRLNVDVPSGFTAGIDAALEAGSVTDEMVDRTASPMVDANTAAGTGAPGATIVTTTLARVPTSRDPWQIINMAPGAEAGVNVGGSASGQQVGLATRGTSANLQWSLEGGSLTDLAANSSSLYYNFGALDQVSVSTGGGDASVQSSGLFINLIMRSGGNSLRGSSVATMGHHALQSNNVSEEVFHRGTTGFLSGAPTKAVSSVSIEFGGPVRRDRLWWWAAADWQHINAGSANFFDAGRSATCRGYADAQRAGSSLTVGSISYSNLEAIQDCLADDTTRIGNKQAKLNLRVTSSHRLQYQFLSHNKTRNARNASADTAPEATTRQTSDAWAQWFPVPTHQLAHTWNAGSRLVLRTLYTYVDGGFNLDYQDSDGPCGLTRYTGSRLQQDAPQSARSECLFNVQPLTIQTTNHQNRSLGNAYQTERPSHDVRTDATFLLANMLGGDHALKFGAGYRRNPVRSYRHFSGGGRAFVQCVGNVLAGCGDASTFVPVGSATGLVPRQAVLQRDSLVNNDWWTWSAYVQDSFSVDRLQVTAGLRYDWQQSKWLGGCVPANVIRPDLLPAQCQDATQSAISPLTGEVEEIQPFGNFAPRMSVTYDIRGTGKTVARASGSYYYATRMSLANALSGLGQVTLTWGPNQDSGVCRASCWTDANRDGVIQSSELTGTPTVSASLFNLTTGALSPTGSSVARDMKLGRTREATFGLQHELRDHLAIGAEVVFRRYDRGPATYVLGAQPGGPAYPLSQLYTGPLTHTDPVSGKSAPYYVIRPGTPRPFGVFSSQTRETYEDYRGLDLTLRKRYDGRWQAGVALTIQTRNDHSPIETLPDGNPTGNEFFDGHNAIARYLLKVHGSYDLPWGLMASTNLNVNDGAIRDLVIDGPGPVFGGDGALGVTTITYDTLHFETTGTTRFAPAALWDIGLRKSFAIGGGRHQVQVMLDGFNILNAATALSYASDNVSTTGTTALPVPPSERISGLLPPRILRVGLRVTF
jgi:hypothetical protein